MRCSALSLVMVLGGLVALSGCGDGGPKTYLVEGKISVNGKPLDSGSINLHSDDPKLTGWSGIVSTGTYTVSAPLGKYKVTVTPMTDTDPTGKSPAIDKTFQDASKTPLSIDVVASPAAGAYDLNLKK